MVARAAGLQSHPQHHIFVRDFKGSSGLFSFQLNDSFSAVAVDELCDSLRVRGPAHQPLPLPPAPAGTRRRALHALGSLCVAVGSSPARRGVTVRLLCVLRVRWRARCACVARALRGSCLPWAIRGAALRASSSRATSRQSGPSSHGRSFLCPSPQTRASLCGSSAASDSLARQERALRARAKSDALAR